MRILILITLLYISACSNKYFHPTKYHPSIDTLNQYFKKCVDHKIKNLKYCQRKNKLKLLTFSREIARFSEFDFYDSAEKNLLKKYKSKYLMKFDVGPDTIDIFCKASKAQEKQLFDNPEAIPVMSNFEMLARVLHVTQLKGHKVFIMDQCVLKKFKEKLKTDFNE
jgi:hypothetical protein